MNTSQSSRSMDLTPASDLWLKLFAVAAFAALLIFPTLAHAADWPKDQTPDLIALRGSSSPAEKKLSFNLFLLARQARKSPIGNFATMIDTSDVNSDGTITVEITAYLSPSLIANPVVAKVVRNNGGRIPLEAYVSDHFQAKVTERELLDIAANPNVLSIRDTKSATMAVNTVPSAVPASR